MKWVSFFLLTPLCVAILSIVSSFTDNTTQPKPFAYTRYYYIGGDGQRIDPGITDVCIHKRSLTKLVQNATYWTTTSPASPNECEDDNCGLYLCSIGFDMETTADGGSDGQLTLQEATDAVWNYYTAQTPRSLPYCVPSPSITEGNTVIYIHRKLDANVCP